MMKYALTLFNRGRDHSLNEVELQIPKDKERFLRGGEALYRINEKCLTF